MNGAKVNYQEGMFLGKQELQNQVQIEDMWKVAFWEIFRTTPRDGGAKWCKGLLDPELSLLTIGSQEIDGTIYLVVGFNVDSSPLTDKTRKVVGFGATYPIGAVELGSRFTNKEGIVSLAGYTNGTWYVKLDGAITHYENALITVNQDGSGRVTKNWDSVKDLFRTASSGRQTKIQTENGQSLTITSVDSLGNLVFSNGSGTLVAESNVRFAFFHTISPYSSSDSDYLYTYPSMSIAVESDDSGNFVLGKFDLSDGVVSNIEVFGPSYQSNKYGFLGLNLRSLQGYLLVDYFADADEAPIEDFPVYDQNVYFVAHSGFYYEAFEMTAPVNAFTIIKYTLETNIWEMQVLAKFDPELNSIGSSQLRDEIKPVKYHELPTTFLNRPLSIQDLVSVDGTTYREFSGKCININGDICIGLKFGQPASGIDWPDIIDIPFKTDSGVNIYVDPSNRTPSSATSGTQIATIESNKGGILRFMQMSSLGQSRALIVLPASGFYLG